MANNTNNTQHSPEKEDKKKGNKKLDDDIKEKDNLSDENHTKTQKTVIKPTYRGFTHRLKQEIAAYVAPPLFKYYMPLEIQQLLDYFVYLLSKHAVGEKTGSKFKDTIIKSLVELFVLFDDGIVPTSDFRDVYQLFRRVCSLCKNTYFRRQVILQREEFDTQNKTEELPNGEGGEIAKEEKCEELKTKKSKGKGKEKVEDNIDQDEHKKKKLKKNKNSPKSDSKTEKPILVDAQAVSRISELVKQLNKEVIDIVIPLHLTKVTVQEIQDIFDVIHREDWIRACFEDSIIGKVICILADFLENY